VDIAYFTKTLQGLSLERAAGAAADIGFDCVDLPCGATPDIATMLPPGATR
jgi:hypothetical protein